MAATRRVRTGRPGDRGVVVVIFAVSLTAMLAVGALVLGGSTGYAAVRNSQTAADAASLAATTQLWRERAEAAQVGGVPDWGEVLAAADAGVARNGADLVGCDIVLAQYAETGAEEFVIGPCNGTNERHVAASGVRVRVQETRDAPFGGVIGHETITADARAAATIQPVRGTFRASFMLCSFAGDHGVRLLLENPAPAPRYEINPAAVADVEILLWANGNGFGNRDCGVSGWHGLVNSDRAYAVPSVEDDPSSWWDTDTGSKVGQLPRQLAGDHACDWSSEAAIDDAEGCKLALPLCVGADGTGTNARFECVRMAVFEITYVGDGRAEGSCASVNKTVVCGRISPGGGLATGGQGAMDTADPHEVVVVKLVE